MEINDPRIEAYLNGELSEADMRAVEQEAQQTPEIWEHIRFQQFMIEGIRREGEAELKDFIANRITEEEQNETTKTGLWWSIAATLVVLLVGLVINYKSASRTLESKTMAESDEKKSQLYATDSTSVVMDSKQNAESSPSEPLLADGQENMADYEVNPHNDIPFDAIEENRPNAESVQPNDIENNAMGYKSAAGKKNASDGDADIPSAAMYLGKLTVTPILINNGIPKKGGSPGSVSGNRLDIAKTEMAADTIMVQEAQRPRAKAKSRVGNSSKTYVFTLIQEGLGGPQLLISGKTDSQTAVTLWNAGSENILMFEYNEQLYLQLGDAYYFYPQSAPVGVKQSLTPVTNANLLNTLRNR